MKTKLIAGSVGIVLLVLLLGAYGMLKLGVTASSSPANAASSRPTVVKVGDLAPEINLKSLTGDQIVLSQLVGHRVLLNFWATWCGPCREEFPALVRKYKQYKDQGLVIIGVNYQDDNSDQGVLTFMRNTLVNFPIVRDSDERFGRMYRVQGLPTSFFIDTQGIVRYIAAGEMTEDLMDQQIAKLQ